MINKTHIYAYPLYYEIGFCNSPIQKEVKFIIESYKKYNHNSPPSSILDNGCGTGIYLEKLAKLGLRVSGYDSSLQMVKYAAFRLKKVTKESHIFRANLKNFRIKDKFDMAIALNGSFQYLISIKDILSHFESVSRVLKLGGLYLISFPSPQDFVDNPPGFIKSQWSHKRGKITVAVNWTYQQHPICRESQTFSGQAKIKVKDNRNIFNLQMPYRYRIFSLKELEFLVKISRNFEIVDIYGDFSLNKVFMKMQKPKCMNEILRKINNA